MGIPKREAREKGTRNTWNNNDKIFSKSDTKSQIQEAREQQAGKKKMPERITLDILFSNYGKSKIKKKVLKEARGKKHLSKGK